jgi:predicted GIY-YIG superfamily endonuclease
MSASINWSVHIILCTDNTLYAGITNDAPDDSTNMQPGGEQNIFAVANLNNWFT